MKAKAELRLLNIFYITGIIKMLTKMLTKTSPFDKTHPIKYKMAILTLMKDIGQCRIDLTVIQ